MKLVSQFESFLKDTVNLNPARVTELEKSIETIKTFIRGSGWQPTILAFEPQGSWAHRTIIKPVDLGEFDADLLVFVKEVEGWTAKQYIDELYAVFRASGTYKDMVKRWSHCVTITYANDRKIDIAPCLRDRGGLARLEVCNRDTDAFERSEPLDYTDWLVTQNGYSGGNSFRKVTRLLKYLRDIKTTFTCSSVLLTTLLGYRITALDQFGDEFSDTPTALKTIFVRLDNWLQANPEKPSVTNPFLQTEDFAAQWTETQYGNFCEVINRYRNWVDEAYDETDRNESIAKWRRVFGDEFAGDVDLEEGRSVSKNAVALLKTQLYEAASFTGDLVSAIMRFGSRALPPGFDKRPYMRSPTWRRTVGPLFQIQVRATLYRSRGYNKIRQIQSLEPVPGGYWLEFSAVTATGLPPGDDFRTRWRITNTDLAAYDARCLRGGFYDSDSGHVRFEELRYRGVHLVEAFVIRKRDGVQVAQSAPFRVLIE